MLKITLSKSSLFLLQRGRLCFNVFAFWYVSFSCRRIEFPLTVRALNIVWVFCWRRRLIACSLCVTDSFDKIFMLSSPVCFGLKSKYMRFKSFNCLVLRFSFSRCWAVHVNYGPALCLGHGCTNVGVCSALIGKM